MNLFTNHIRFQLITLQVVVFLTPNLILAIVDYINLFLNIKKGGKSKNQKYQDRNNDLYRSVIGIHNDQARIILIINTMS
jgi:hypothetical protein